jgi:hypothetical protein
MPRSGGRTRRAANCAAHRPSRLVRAPRSRFRSPTMASLREGHRSFRAEPVWASGAAVGVRAGNHPRVALVGGGRQIWRVGSGRGRQIRLAGQFESLPRLPAEAGMPPTAGSVTPTPERQPRRPRHHAEPASAHAGFIRSGAPSEVPARLWSSYRQRRLATVSTVRRFAVTVPPLLMTRRRILSISSARAERANSLIPDWVERLRAY